MFQELLPKVSTEFSTKISKKTINFQNFPEIPPPPRALQTSQSWDSLGVKQQPAKWTSPSQRPPILHPPSVGKRCRQWLPKKPRAVRSPASANRHTFSAFMELPPATATPLVSRSLGESRGHGTHVPRPFTYACAQAMLRAVCLWESCSARQARPDPNPYADTHPFRDALEVPPPPPSGRTPHETHGGALGTSRGGKGTP